MSSAAIFVGLDVAKLTLDLAVRPTGETWAVPNEEAGVAQVVTRLQELRPTLIVCEATGGYEQMVRAHARLGWHGPEPIWWTPQ